MIVKGPPRLVRAAAALCGAAVFVAAFAGALYAVSQKPEPPAKKTAAAHAVVLTKTKPPPQKKKTPQRTRRRAARASKSLAPPPVGGGLTPGGFSLGPALDAAQADSLTDELVGDTSDIALTADTVDSPPRIVKGATPEYPAALRRRGVEGEVLLALVIAPDGRVTSSRVLASEPPGVFDAYALAAADKTRFNPQTKNGEPVSTRVELPYVWSLSQP